MPSIDLDEAGPALPRLVAVLGAGEETEFIITRAGAPVALLIAAPPRVTGQRIGVAKGVFTAPETIDDANDEIAEQFGAGLETVDAAGVLTAHPIGRTASSLAGLLKRSDQDALSIDEMNEAMAASVFERNRKTRT